MPNTSSHPSYDLFGAKITPMTLDGLMQLITRHVESRTSCVIASQNLHGMHVRLWDTALRMLHALPQTFVHIDGLPLVFMCKLRGIEAKRHHRLTLVDWIWPLLSLAASNGWRVYYVGAKPDVVDAGTAVIAKRLPDLQLRAHHGYFHDPDGRGSWDVLRDISAYRPQLVLVGMGMGVQERWILEHLRALEPATICTVGACMEYIAGVAKTPPRWMGPLGLEWLFRLSENPGRFWYRYLVEPWFVLAYIGWYLTLPAQARAAGKLEFERIDLRAAAPELAPVAGSAQG
jgi:N-acetylglucosaminyldiphosphoundecaprenol N-acetyl-beta-D-mannosaminyltransferase